MVKTKEEELQDCLMDILNSITIQDKWISEKMLICACIKYYQHPEKYEPDKFYTDLYREVADELQKTVANVEKSIRSVITNAWNRGNPDNLYGLFGAAVPRRKDKATAKRFIREIAEILDSKLK